MIVHFLVHDSSERGCVERYGCERYFRREAGFTNSALCLPATLGGLARPAPSELKRTLAQDRQERRWGRYRDLRPGSRNGAALWLDRWAESSARRHALAPALHPAGTAEQVVKDQPRQGHAIDRGQRDAARRAGGGRAS